MYVVRKWSVSRARWMDRAYRALERGLIALAPLWEAIGYERMNKPFSVLERLIKGFLFDCQMCGHCELSETGMSCPMNCPKSLRHGPCGGVRANGRCEVDENMRCVWVEAHRGNTLLGKTTSVEIRPPVDFRHQGSSSWLRVVQQARAEKAAQLSNEEA